jgi:hypothetical protein
MDRPIEERNLPTGGTVSLLRHVTLTFSPKLSSVGDRMVLHHLNGNYEDIVVTEAGGAPKLKRVVMQMELASSTPALSALTGSHYSLVDLDKADEKRLQAIYDMFPKPV